MAKENLQLHIVDGKFVMLTVSDKHEKERTNIKINQEESIQSLREIFFALWEKLREI